MTSSWWHHVLTSCLHHHFLQNYTFTPKRQNIYNFTPLGVMLAGHYLVLQANDDIILMTSSCLHHLFSKNYILAPKVKILAFMPSRWPAPYLEIKPSLSHLDDIILMTSLRLHHQFSKIFTLTPKDKILAFLPLRWPAMSSLLEHSLLSFQAYLIKLWCHKLRIGWCHPY